MPTLSPRDARSSRDRSSREARASRDAGRPSRREGDANTAYPDTAFAGDRHPAPRGALVVRAAATVELAVGCWLAASPWVVGSGGSSLLRWNDLVIGVVLTLLALVRLARPATTGTPTITFVLGAWTIVAAFVLSFQNGATGTTPLWNAILCAAALIIATAWSTTEAERAQLRR